MLDASLTWKDVEWLRSLTTLPVILKGICRADDAKLAVESGWRSCADSHGRRCQIPSVAQHAIDHTLAACAAKVLDCFRQTFQSTVEPEK
jgi:isopentenyl diphosphate isomerase/L-lactate dehydrogenase-like FMN-dependent dehydrogenase